MVLPDKKEESVDVADAESLAVWTEGHGTPEGGVVCDGPPFLADEGVSDDLTVGQVGEDT